MTRGGKRPGAGRPVAPTSIPIRFNLTPLQHQIYLANGGAQWAKRVLFGEKAPGKADG